MTRFECGGRRRPRPSVSSRLTLTPSAILEVLISEDDARRELARAEGREARDRPLLDVPRGDGKGGAADLTRADLIRARLTRPDPTRDDDSQMPFTFHGLRHTCITHWAVAGKDELFLLTARFSPFSASSGGTGLPRPRRARSRRA